MRVPTSCRSITSTSRSRSIVRGRFARLAVERVDRHAPDVVARVTGLDHVLLHVGSEPVLRSEDRREARAGCCGESIDDVPQLGVDRCRIADEADAPAVEVGRIEQAVGAKSHAWVDYEGPATRSHFPGYATGRSLKKSPTRLSAPQTFLCLLV